MIQKVLYRTRSAETRDARNSPPHFLQQMPNSFAVQTSSVTVTNFSPQIVVICTIRLMKLLCVAIRRS